ncbi:lysylphosphatidylglycerol synthase transmembrane domain-containing protein [Rufibacter sediminis]|uniref:Flippase-like domain-containing protein n=1 Tax=Rufibacter sediminis TaxID=2762756 RepID=A0ABR6VRS6_9BACT|nr:lysylphosphatidylglycerol synthase transmembrane domain-containing protein [Rufibacter sediminis]MBC3539558.1 flippase-like domain-containing protein [Rufibacter sediminis]
MKKTVNVLKYLLLLAVSVFLMAYALRSINFTAVKAELAQANYVWIGATLLLSVAGYVSRAIRWRMQYAPLGYTPQVRHTYHALMVGYLANVVLPRAGEVIRCTWLRRSSGVPVNVSLGTVITERVIDLVMLLLCMSLTLLFEFERLQNFFLDLFSERLTGIQQNLQTLYLLGAIAVIGTGLVVWYTYKNIAKLRENVIFRKVSDFARGIWQGIFSIAKMEQKGAFIFHTLFIWFTYYLTSYLAFFALPGTEDLTWQAGLAILVVGGLGMSAPVQGGIGVYHILVRTALLLYAVPLDKGMAYALITHTTGALLVVLMGGISLVASLAQSKEEEPAKQVA